MQIKTSTKMFWIRPSWVAAIGCSLACSGCGASPVTEAPDSGSEVEPSGPKLGGHIEPAGTHAQFRVRSKRATRIDVAIYAQAFDADPVATSTLELEPGSDVWAARLPLDDLPEIIHYGYRAWGPNWESDPSWTPGSEAGFVIEVDDDGNRFNPNKLLIDPYAREISHDPTNATHTDYGIYGVGSERRAIDSGPMAPKSLVITPVGNAGQGRPQRAHKDAVIYEVHLRGLTQTDPSISAACRGTYAGAAEKADYLEKLGVNTVEFLPVQETSNDANDNSVGTGGDNYWGYSTLAFFAPDRRYACDKSPGGPTREFRAMVDAFHDRGIAVYIDVVYNHTAEGGGGSLLSWRGLDNASYYELNKSGDGFVDNTGIGANTNTAGQLMADLTLDSLRYWHEEMGVDGFRFDLAAVLGNSCERECFEFDGDNPNGLLKRALEVLPDARLIAEPWGIGVGTYQIGNFPSGWAEWNGRYRDHIRSDQNRHGIETATLGTLATRLAGSPDLYGDDQRAPFDSINFIVSHDGFTLNDLHSCNEKNNGQAWPYGPSDGGDNHNIGWDHRNNRAEQRKAVRTSLALLFLSAGVPMITGGDERFRSQRCNNNAYNLDSVGNWLDWSESAEARGLLSFTTRLIQFRNEHHALRPDHFPNFEELTWFRPDGGRADPGFLNSSNQHALAWRIEGAAFGDSADALLMLYNGNTASLRFILPLPPPGKRWYRVLDTGTWFETQSNADPIGDEHRLVDPNYDVESRAVAVFELR